MAWKNLVTFSLALVVVAWLFQKSKFPPKCSEIRSTENSFHVQKGFRDPEDLLFIPISSQGFQPLPHHDLGGQKQLNATIGSLLLASSMVMDTSVPLSEIGIRAWFIPSPTESHSEQHIPFKIWPPSNEKETPLSNLEDHPSFGEPTCMHPPDFKKRLNIHGIGGYRISETNFLLAAVFHEPRESIEFFTLSLKKTGVPLTKNNFKVSWSGCYFLEEGTMVGNDVEITGDGKWLFVTNYMPSFKSKLKQFWYTIQGCLGIGTGNILYRPLKESKSSPNQWKVIAGKRLSNPNGLIHLTEPGNGTTILFYAQSGLGKFCGIVLPKNYNMLSEKEPEQTCMRIPWTHLDNLHYRPSNGHLLSGAHTGSLALGGCMMAGYTGGLPYCPSGWEAVDIDPWEMKYRILSIPHGGCIGGVASVAEDPNEHCLYLGSLYSDRIGVWCPNQVLGNIDPNSKK